MQVQQLAVPQVPDLSAGARKAEQADRGPVSRRFGLTRVLPAAMLVCGQALAADLLVSSRFSDSVLRYDGESGAFKGVFASGNGLDNPNGIAYGPDGNLYVGLGDVGRVMVFDGQTGDYLRDFVAPATSGGLAGCRAIAFLSNGDLLVSSGASDQVLRYAAVTGVFRGVFAQGGGLDGPVGLAVSASGEVYVGGALSNAVHVYGSNGAYLRNLPVLAGSRSATGLAFGFLGNLLISQSTNNQLLSVGTAALSVPTVFANAGDLNVPIGMLLHPGGDLLVASFGNDKVVRYNGRNGSLVGDFIQSGSGGLDGPHFLTWMGAPPPAPTALFGIDSGAKVTALRSLADLDGDRRRDLAIGQGELGQVILGASSTAQPLWVAQGPTGFGTSLAESPDVNLDGYQDLLVGAPLATNGGRARVLSGRTGQVLLDVAAPVGAKAFGATLAALRDVDGSGSVTLIVGAPGPSFFPAPGTVPHEAGRVWLLSGADGSLVREHAGAAGDALGSAVAALGDVDGDGLADYALGAVGEGTGRVHIHSSRSGKRLYSVSGEHPGSGFGLHLAAIGDVDGDGIDDFHVGAQAADHDGGELHPDGAIRLYSGKDGRLLRQLRGLPFERLGQASTAGDVDGDGRSDLITVAPSYSGAGVSTGGRIQVVTASGQVLMEVRGKSSGELIGPVAALGDFDGDQRFDLASVNDVGRIQVHGGVIERPLVPPAASSNRSGTWWDAAAPGWGIHLMEQGDLLFGTWYSYAEDGKPMFLTVQATLAPSLQFPPGTSPFVGSVYRVSGTPFQQITGSQAFTSATQVGDALLVFAEDGNLNMNYRVDSVAQTKTLQRFDISAQLPLCWGSPQSRAELLNYSDLWWKPSEAGWGISLAHEGDSIFALWYTYGEGGRDQWLSASSLKRQADGSFVGSLQRPLSGVPLAQINGPATTFPVPDVGTARLRFSDGEHGIFEYSVDGVSQRKAITRFAPLAHEPKPHCVDPPTSQASIRSEFIATRLSEQGVPVQLEMVVHKPAGNGPFPTVMFNHGSTGFGNDPSLFALTSTHRAAANWFNERGWMVVFPQRRGRGRSNGAYAEGLAANGSGYSCDPAISLPGMERALTDLDEVVHHLKGRPDVDQQRLLIAGHSRGGILSVVHAGSRTDNPFIGAINFVGGWMSDQCPSPSPTAINTASFRRGGTFPGPTLWLYGENDSFYSMGHSRANYAAFLQAGGRGAFHALQLGTGVNGHNVISLPQVWGPLVDNYLESLR